MAKFKLVLGDMSGKTKQIEVESDNAKSLIGMQIGDKVKGELVDMPGYEFEITGGSDASGFPMRKDVKLAGKKKILIVSGVGLHNDRKGKRVRKTVAGAIVHEKTAQINMKVLKTGKTPLFEEPKAEEPTEAPAQEPKKEE